ncbi:hypothetical protein K6U70_21120 [Vibrio vulnificus]|uniref:hypothetical protein n=1 Tax=Vibrio vulnificus TaxID=672 RepID=UPI001EECE3EE|nr:hypothetical protein [Vibrio vulnificus]MCG6274619.1 hypothetical protein [Vibrio vulnificus]
MAKFLTALAFAYRSHFCLSSSRTRGSILKREDVFESIKPTKSVRPAFAEEWIPAFAGMTAIDSGKISYCLRFCLPPSLLLVILANAGIHLTANGGDGESQREVKNISEEKQAKTLKI